MAKVNNLIQMANARPVQRDTSQDLAAIILSSQTAMADVITRNFKGEIKDQVCAECASITATLERDLKAFIRSEIAALPVPERVIERTVETVTERVEAAEADDAPQTVTVQRKDGLINGVKVGKVAYDVVRNKQGMIKEVVPRGM